MPVLPYVIGVQFNQSSGSGRADVSIVLTNVRTEETLTETTNSSGQVIFDLGNLEDGYIIGDKLTIGKSVLDGDMEYFITANGDETNPTWVEVENETRTRLYPNTVRFKLNTARNPGGKTDLNITLN